MKSFVTLLATLLLAAWIVAIAILSVQNAAPVTLRWFNSQSIALPFGLVLAFSAALGALGMAVIQPFFKGAGTR